MIISKCCKQISCFGDAVRLFVPLLEGMQLLLLVQLLAAVVRATTECNFDPRDVVQEEVSRPRWLLSLLNRLLAFITLCIHVSQEGKF